MHYHIRVTKKSDPNHDETKVDLTEEDLISRFLRPYEHGEAIVINGKTIFSQDIDRIKISKSNQNSREIIQRLENEDDESPVAMIGGPSYVWRAADRSIDVTDQYIKGPPGHNKNNVKKQDKSQSSTSLTEDDLKRLTFSQLIGKLSVGAWSCVIVIFCIAVGVAFKVGVFWERYERSGSKEVYDSNEKTVFKIKNLGKNIMASGKCETKYLLKPMGQNVIPLLIISVKTTNGAIIENVKMDGSTLPGSYEGRVSDDKTEDSTEIRVMRPGDVSVLVITNKDPGQLLFSVDPS